MQTGQTRLLNNAPTRISCVTMGNVLYRLRTGYDRLAIRCADSLEGLRDAEEVVVWRKPDTGPMSQLIWAPELHHIDGRWYIYFAATHTRALDQLGMFQHRMFAIECADGDPLTGTWVEKGQNQNPV